MAWKRICTIDHLNIFLLNKTQERLFGTMREFSALHNLWLEIIKGECLYKLTPILYMFWLFCEL